MFKNVNIYVNMDIVVNIVNVNSYSESVECVQIKELDLAAMGSWACSILLTIWRPPFSLFLSYETNKFIIYWVCCTHSFCFLWIKQWMEKAKATHRVQCQAVTQWKKALPRVVELKNIGIIFERRDGMQNNR